MLTFYTVAAQAEQADALWQPRVELEARSNSDRSLVSPKLLMPLAQDDHSLLFADLRTRLDDADSQEYNLGLGYRRLQGDWVLGGYGFADYLHSDNEFGYWQMTAGAEALSKTWEFRANGYLPQSTQHALGGGGGVTVGPGGNLNIGGGGVERALPGFDAEAGYNISTSYANLGVFGGMYYFGADGFDDVSGPKGRFEATVTHEHFQAIPEGIEFTAGVQYQNDGPREGTTTALAQLRIPLGAPSHARKPANGAAARMTDFIRRDVDIIAQKGTAGSEAATTTIDGTSYSAIATTVDASTLDANAALTGAGANSLVVFKDAINLSAALEPLQGQSLIGAGSRLTVTGQSSGKSASYVIPGTRPTITAPSSDTGIRVGNSDVSVRGVDIVAPGSGTGLMVSAQNFAGDDIHVTGSTGGYGVMVSTIPSANAVFRNITETGASDGFSSFNSSGIRVEDSSFNSNAFEGIYLNNSDDVVFDGVTSSNNGSHGIALVDAQNATGNVAVSGNVGGDCVGLGTLTGSSVTLNGGPATCP